MPHKDVGSGFFVALSKDGSTVLVGGPFVSVVYVFHVSSPGAWKSTARPVAALTDPSEPADFSSALALSANGTTALIGVPLGADVFHVASAAAWRSSSTPAATLVPDAASAQEFGLDIAVALSADGTTALIGAVRDGNFFGRGYIFRATAADDWVSSTTPAAILTDGGPADYFGFAVALSPGGTAALVGAPFAGIDGLTGAAYFFQVPSLSYWVSYQGPVAVVQSGFDQYGGGYGGARSGRYLGRSVALSGERTALVGEPSYLGGGTGAAEIFHITGRRCRARRCGPPSWAYGRVSSAKLTDAADRPGDRFGGVVGLSSDGKTALVSSGRAFLIFTRAGSWSARFCYVPYVDSKALPEAKRTIESTHCSLGPVTRVTARRVRRNHVISQRPAPGQRIPKASKVDLTVSTGPRH